MNFKEAYLDTCSTVSKAARLGEVNALKYLIQIGKSIDIKDNRGWQSIHEAAYHGHNDCLNIIIIEGAEVDCRTFEEETALMLACKGGHTECVQCLLDAGADPNSTTKEDFTPLWEAAVVNIECVKMLIEAGARINYPIFTGDTALHEVVNQHKNLYTNVVKCLVDSGADISIQNEWGLTPLFLAAQFGLTECLQYLIACAEKEGEDFKRKLINKTAYDNASALYLATQEEHVDCVRLLIENGADPNIKLDLTDGTSPIQIVPLQVALEKGNVECVKLLVKVTDLKQFRTTFTSNSDHHPIAYAVEHSSEECIKILLKQEFFKNYYKEKIIECHNPFRFEIKIRPAIVFVKSFPERVNEWFVPFSSFSYGLHLSSLSEDYLFLLLCLRLGSRQQFLEFLFSSTPAVLECWCAMLKYFRRGCFCSNNNCDSIPCLKASCNPVWTQKSDITNTTLKQLQLCLSCPVLDDSQVPGNRCWQLKQIYQDAYGTNQVDAREICSLQTMCRQTVVLQLIYSDKYNKAVIQTCLNIPKPLQQYLMFDGTDFGEEFMSACQYLVEEEDKLDKLMQDVSID